MREFSSADTKVKDVVIGTISGYNEDTIKYWLNSLDCCGFSGDKVLLVCRASRCVLAELSGRGYNAITYAQDLHTGDAYFPEEPYEDEDSSVLRFYLIWEFLRRTADHYRFVISVDVRDAVFQTNPSEWLESSLQGKELLASSESIRYEDEEWNRASMLANFGEPVHDLLRRSPIYNAGVVAGTPSVMRDLCLNIALICRGASLPYADQAALNILLNTEPFRRLTHFSSGDEGWACHGATFASAGDAHDVDSPILDSPPVLEGATIYTGSGAPYCIVHQYDRVPAWRHALQQKYASSLPIPGLA